MFCVCPSPLLRNYDIHSIGKAEKKVSSLKQICNSCYLTIRDEPKPRNCYICFYKNHEDGICPQMKKVPQFFPPAIDNLLIPRFMQTLTAREWYFLAYLSPQLLCSKTSRFQGVLNREIRIKCLENYLAVSSVYLHQYNSTFSKNELRKILIFNGNYVLLQKCFLSTEDFFYLLQPRITKFFCYRLLLSRTFKFSDVLSRIPEIEELQITMSDIKIGKSWMEEFQRYVDIEKCSSLEIDLEYGDFNIAKVAEFLKTKCQKGMKLTIKITHLLGPNYYFYNTREEAIKAMEKAMEELRNKILEHFVAAHTCGICNKQLEIAVHNPNFRSEIPDPLGSFTNCDCILS